MPVVQCHKCAQKLKLPKEKVGQRGKCPSCGTVQLLGPSTDLPIIDAEIVPPPKNNPTPPVWQTPAVLWTVIPLGLLFACCGGCGLLALLVPSDKSRLAEAPLLPDPVEVAAKDLPNSESEITTPASIPADVKFTVIDETRIPGIKRSVDIRLNKYVSEATLSKIAKTVKASDGRDYDRTFIGYYLPGMKVNSGYWATTHYNPKLKVRILGLSADAAAKLSAKPTTKVGTEIGRWLDESPFGAHRVVIFRDKGKLFMESTYGDGSNGTKELVESQSSHGRRFTKLGGSTAGDHWILDTNGDLQLRDDEGLISTAKKLP